MSFVRYGCLKDDVFVRYGCLKGVFCTLWMSGCLKDIFLYFTDVSDIYFFDISYALNGCLRLI